MRYIKLFNESSKYYPDDVYTSRLWHWLEEIVPDEIDVDIIYGRSRVKSNYIFKFPIKFIEINFKSHKGKKFLEVRFCNTNDMFLSLLYILSSRNVISDDGDIGMSGYDIPKDSAGRTYVGWNCSELIEINKNICEWVWDEDHLKDWLINR